MLYFQNGNSGNKKPTDTNVTCSLLLVQPSWEYFTTILLVLSKAEGTGALLKTHCCECHRSHIIQSAVRPLVIVIHPSAICNISQLINTQKRLSIKQFISEPAVERPYLLVLPCRPKSFYYPEFKMPELFEKPSLSGTGKHPDFQVTSCHQNVTTNTNFARIKSE